MALRGLERHVLGEGTTREIFLQPFVWVWYFSAMTFQVSFETFRGHHRLRVQDFDSKRTLGFYMYKDYAFRGNVGHVDTDMDADALMLAMKHLCEHHQDWVRKALLLQPLDPITFSLKS